MLCVNQGEGIIYQKKNNNKKTCVTKQFITVLKMILFLALMFFKNKNDN